MTAADKPEAQPSASALADLNELNDAELVQLVRLPPDRLGCWLWLAPLPLGTLLAVTLDPGVAALGFCVTLGTAWLSARIRARSPRRRLAELAKQMLAQRFCTDPIEHYEPAARAALRDDPALQTVLLFSGRALPHGGWRFIRIELGQSSRIALRSLPFDLGDIPRETAGMFRCTLPLRAASAARVQALIAEIDPARPEPPAEFVYDGFPCSALVLRRDAEPLRIDVNLGGLTREQRAHPSARLLHCILDLEDEVFAAGE
jgi:hypothetical protein